MTEHRAFARQVARELSNHPVATASPLPPQPVVINNSGDDAVLRAVKILFDRSFARIEALEQRRAAQRGADGIGVVDAHIDGDGCLVLEFSDGFTRNVGRVVGADAPPALPPKTLEIVRDGDGRVVRGVLR